MLRAVKIVPEKDLAETAISGAAAATTDIGVAGDEASRRTRTGGDRRVATEHGNT
jgi:hypothetical protein